MSINTSKLRFKGFEFNYNPHTFTISGRRNIVEFLSPVSGSIVQDLGASARTITGEGVLLGADCNKQYEQLFATFLQEQSGLLQIPDMKPFYAFFASLSVTAKPTPNLLYYSFKFIEDVRSVATNANS